MHLVGELLGTESAEERATYYPGATGEGLRGNWARIHNTLHLTSAYIALAAAANGANVVVEGICDHGSKIFPREPHPDEQPSMFLLRLWLTQPPEHICGILRHYKDLYASNESESSDKRGENVTIVGGSMEIAIAMARKLGLRLDLTHGDELEGLTRLWRRSTAYGISLRWSVKMRTTLGFALEPPEVDPDLPGEAGPLLKIFQEAYQLSNSRYLRAVADIIYNTYRLTSYPVFDHKYDVNEDQRKSELITASRFVLLCISIGALRELINPVGDTLDVYALNLATLDFGNNRGLYGLLRLAIGGLLTPSRALEVAATVWGGSYFERDISPWKQQSPERLLGIVTPHCTIIFDMLRDSQNLLLPYDRWNYNLLSLWRGAVPMLPRDPLTNGIFSGHDEDWNHSTVSIERSTRPTPPDASASGPMLITLEPYGHEANCGVFCFWYNGHLVAEFAPHSILTAALSILAVWELDPGQVLDEVPDVIELSKEDLLGLRRFVAHKSANIIVNVQGDASWSLFAIGCAFSSCGELHPPHILHTFIVRERSVGLGFIKQFRETLHGGNVLVVIP
ncbi:hypothetical protein F5Y07DRAFT_413365 [Xylaria sp. FL0933]|nr:hypothetical protein F5Y07DRAFT_413365 [Xylaria sp. FL0933]